MFNIGDVINFRNNIYVILEIYDYNKDYYEASSRNVDYTLVKYQDFKKYIDNNKDRALTRNEILKSCSATTYNYKGLKEPNFKIEENLAPYEIKEALSIRQKEQKIETIKKWV